ncbi:type II toxin-antitoxin system HicA family toxin [Candidatus Daviesbacteria bacterium]|nr:type II toxin-antitoxin system HicA family toxin [Candidatus Daviesbacteria bacterium]
MPKLYSAKQVLSALKRAGFSEISQRGSHIKLVKNKPGATLVVIVPNHKEIALGTFRSILRQADLSKGELEKLVK